MGNSLSKLNNIVKYDNGFIYTIYHENNLIYVGSTVNFDWKDYHFKIIDVYYNITKQLLTKIEGDYIRYFNFDNLLNCEMAGRTREEYYLDNKDELTIKHKIYNQNNKDKIKITKSRPWTCIICDKTIKVNSKYDHLKSNKHINKTNNQ